MTIKIEIESSEMILYRKKADGSPYFKQEIFVHTVNRSGQPNRYPERAELYVPKDSQGNQVALPVGVYVMDPTSFKVENAQLVLGFLTLKPLQPSTKTKAA